MEISDISSQIEKSTSQKLGSCVTRYLTLNTHFTLYCNKCNATREILQFSIEIYKQGKVFVKKHLQSSKYDPLVEEANLIEAEPQYAHIKFPNGQESTVSIRDLAPLGNSKPPHTNAENTDEKSIIHTEHTSQLNEPLITDKKILLDTESNNDILQVQPSYLPYPQVQPYSRLPKQSQ